MFFFILPRRQGASVFYLFSPKDFIIQWDTDETDFTDGRGFLTANCD